MRSLHIYIPHAVIHMSDHMTYIYIHYNVEDDLCHMHVGKEINQAMKERMVYRPSLKGMKRGC